MEATLAALQIEYNNLKNTEGSQVGSLTDALAAKDAALADLMKERDSLEEKMVSLQETVNSTQEQLNTAAVKISNLTDANMSLQAEVSTMTSEREVLSRDLASAISDKARLEESVSSMKVELDGARVDSERLVQNGEIEKEVEEYKERVSEMERQCAKLTATNGT